MAHDDHEDNIFQTLIAPVLFPCFAFVALAIMWRREHVRKLTTTQLIHKDGTDTKEVLALFANPRLNVQATMLGLRPLDFGRDIKHLLRAMDMRELARQEGRQAGARRGGRRALGVRGQATHLQDGLLLLLRALRGLPSLPHTLERLTPRPLAFTLTLLLHLLVQLVLRRLLCLAVHLSLRLLARTQPLSSLLLCELGALGRALLRGAPLRLLCLQLRLQVPLDQKVHSFALGLGRRRAAAEGDPRGVRLTFRAWLGRRSHHLQWLADVQLRHGRSSARLRPRSKGQFGDRAAGEHRASGFAFGWVHNSSSMFSWGQKAASASEEVPGDEWEPCRGGGFVRKAPPPSAAAAPLPRVLWCAIARDDLLLAEAMQGQVDSGSSEARELATALIAKKPSPGWEFERAGSLRGLKFHVHERSEDGGSIVWAYVAIHDSKFPEQSAKCLVERLVLQTAPLRGSREWRSAAAHSLQRGIGHELSEQLERVNATGRTKMVSESVDEVKAVMEQNIELLLDRGERLDQLGERTDAMAKLSATFHRSAQEAKRFQMMQQAKFGMVVGTALAVGVGVLAAPVLAVL